MTLCQQESFDFSAAKIAPAELTSRNFGKSVNHRRHFPCWGQLSRQCRDNFPRNTSEKKRSHNLFIRSGLCASFTNAAGMAMSARQLCHRWCHNCYVRCLTVGGPNAGSSLNPTGGSDLLTLNVNDAYLACGLQRLVLLIEVCRIHEASSSALIGSRASVNMAE
jgi:hypothetical protein